MINIIWLVLFPILIHCSEPDSPRTAFKKAFDLDKQSAQRIKAQQAKVKELDERGLKHDAELHQSALNVYKSAFESKVKATAALMAKVPIEQLDPSFVALQKQRMKALRTLKEKKAHTKYLREYTLRIQPPVGGRSKLGIPYIDACHIRAAEAEESVARSEFEEFDRKWARALLNSLMS
ncbi:MAG TPA: hypothetical protein VFF04_01590 [Candidatus Babeliales bacterium]|nr:hypothetical protein [Candidatus Babeliales bacterium]